MRDPLHRIARIPTALLSDALARLGTMAAAIKPVARGMRLTGIAHTVRCYPGDYLTLLKALAEAREGEVLVVDGGGMLEAALLGKLMAIEARRKGIKGFVIDGAVRDLHDLEDVGVPVFARAATPRVGTAEHLRETQVPIICGGAPVQPAISSTETRTASWSSHPRGCAPWPRAPSRSSVTRRRWCGSSATGAPWPNS